MSNQACFYCRNAINGRVTAPGWTYDCTKGINNKKMDGGVEQALTCPECDLRLGFQIGGYYTHMYFERDGTCLEWHISSDGEFPITDEDNRESMNLHVCDFEQIEIFVKVWGAELRRRGWIK